MSRLEKKAFPHGKFLFHFLLVSELLFNFVMFYLKYYIMRLTKNLDLTLTPDEKRILSRLPTAKYNFIVKCVKAVLTQQFAFEMKVWKDGRVVFTPKNLCYVSKS